MGKNEQPIAIDRLPYSGNRDDSDAGISAEPAPIWTRESIQREAQRRGKRFNPNPEINDRLDEDLAAGALVLFSIEQLDEAIAAGVIPQAERNGLVDFIGSRNDIAVVPVALLERWKPKNKAGGF